jgi:hypothetical protein
MSDRDPRELADQLEREADHLERPSKELEGRVKALRDDWERKRADQGVPGAAPPEGNEGDGESDEPSSQAPDAPPPADAGD